MLAKVFPAVRWWFLRKNASKRGDVLAGNTVFYGATSGQLYVAAKLANASRYGIAAQWRLWRVWASTDASI